MLESFRNPLAVLLALLVAGIVAVGPELHHLQCHEHAHAAHDCGSDHRGDTPDGDGDDPDEDGDRADDCIVCLTLGSLTHVSAAPTVSLASVVGDRAPCSPNDRGPLIAELGLPPLRGPPHR